MSTGRFITGWVKNKQKRLLKLYIKLLLISHALKICHTCVCSLFLVIKHISTGLYVYEFASTRVHQNNCVTGKNCVVHKARLTCHIITVAFYTIPVHAQVSMQACMTLANEHAAAKSLLQVKGFIDVFSVPPIRTPAV